MKTQCDICKARVAFVFCTTEEMALCNLCDAAHHHRAADDHRRLPFFYPNPKPFPICDNCQETKAFIFCLEHRAILCRSCDMSVHHAMDDDFRKQHRRFLHSGAKLRDDDDGRVSSSSSGGGTSSSGMFSTSTPPSAQAHASDDPYGFCKKNQESSRFTFSDTDLGSYLSSLSPKSP